MLVPLLQNNLLTATAPNFAYVGQVTLTFACFGTQSYVGQVNLTFAVSGAPFFNPVYTGNIAAFRLGVTSTTFVTHAHIGQVTLTFECHSAPTGAVDYIYAGHIDVTFAVFSSNQFVQLDVTSTAPPSFFSTPNPGGGGTQLIVIPL